MNATQGERNKDCWRAALDLRCIRAIALLLILWAGATAWANTKPNVVVFLVDDLGYMDIGANNPRCFYDTPRIDRLAASGMRFTDGYAANPVCSPTRYSLMTGKYPTRVKATNYFSGKNKCRFAPAPLHEQMDEDEVTLAEVLKGRGYTTFFAGKWHLGPSEAFYPQNQGFDVNVGGHHGGGPYSGKRYFAPFKNPQMKKESPEGEHLPARLARDTAAFIRKNKDTPFLAYLSFYSVHTPLMGRPDLVEKYEKRAKAISGAEFAEEEQVIGTKLRQVRILQKHAVYAAMVEAMDQAVGTVLDELETCGLSDNTIVVFTSDNGGLSTSEGSPTSNLPLRGGKGWVYEGGIREPWIVRYPGVTKPGTISTQPICSIDLLPTIATAAGARLTHRVDGIDITPALKNNPLQREALYWHYPHYSNQGGIPGGAIRMGDYKLFERYEDGRFHLYNLKTDIGEKHDLAQTMPEQAAMMRANLHAWYKQVNAEFLQEHKESGPPWRPGLPARSRAAVSRKNGLPRVLIIGDSISLGYTPHVKRMLEGAAVVSHHKGNAQHTGTGLKRLDRWIDYTPWDVIHFNWGLWDLCYRHPQSKVQGNRDKVNGTVTTTLEQYEKNLDTLVTRLKKTGAQLIWAHTTVVPEKEAGRIVGDDKKYNDVATRIMNKHGVAINDLNSLTERLPSEMFVKPGDVHFTKDGYKKIAEQVADVTMRVLKKD